MVACLSAVETEASSATLNALLQPRLTTTTGPSNKGTSAPPPRKTGSYASAGDGKAPGAVLGPDDPRLVARNRHGHTALHCAAFSQSPTAVSLLLKAGADCTIGDKAGRTAVEVALNLNKKKATALREGARGGSAPAAECLRLLKERCVGSGCVASGTQGGGWCVVRDSRRLMAAEFPGVFGSLSVPPGSYTIISEAVEILALLALAVIQLLLRHLVEVVFQLRACFCERRWCCPSFLALSDGRSSRTKRKRGSVLC